MGDTCYQLFIGQYKKLVILFIPLCLKSSEKYSLNLLGIVTLLYHMYIDDEIYNLA